MNNPEAQEVLTATRNTADDRQSGDEIGQVKERTLAASTGRDSQPWVVKNIMEILTALILLTYVTSDYFLWKELKLADNSARVDQRPWIQVSINRKDAPLVAAGRPLSVSTHIANYGKTPAKLIVGSFVIAKVKNGEEPKFEYPKVHDGFTVGLMYPNAPVETTVTMLDESQASQENLIPRVVTAPEAADFEKRAIFYVVYGKISYTDLARVEHWTHFCNFIATTATQPAVTAKKCTDYNDIDDN